MDRFFCQHGTEKRLRLIEPQALKEIENLQDRA
jgi:hypothetical protein